MKNFLTEFLDIYIGILRRRYMFAITYTLAMGLFFMILFIPTDLTNIIKTNFLGQNFTIEEFTNYIQDGSFFILMMNVYLIQVIILLTFKTLKIIFSKCGRKSDEVMDIIEIVFTYLYVGLLCNSYKNVYPFDEIVVTTVFYYLIFFCYKKFVVAYNINSRLFRKIYSVAPMGKATIMSETKKEGKTVEPTKDEKENAEHQTLTVQKLIDKLEKVEEMDVSVRYGSVIVDATDVFECESDGVPFMCIDCAEVKKSE